MNFLEVTFLGNPVWRWFLALGIGAIFYICVFKVLLSFFAKKITKWTQNSKNKLDDILPVLFKNVSFLTKWILSIIIAVQVIKLPEKAREIFGISAFIVLLIQIAWWAQSLIIWAIDRQVAKKSGIQSAKTTLFPFISFFIKLLIWTAVLLMALDNLGINVTTFLAGLGVGGIAIALASQQVLSDLFSSLSLVLDKPFVVGDFIIVENFMGTVEYIGLKTTRLRSLSGEQIIFSNSDLLKSRIRNYQRMSTRRVEYQFNIIFETPVAQLQHVPQIVQEVITSHSDLKFDRCHLKSFGEAAFVYEVVYFVQNSDFNIYMDRQQNINFALLERFEKEKIKLAYPTRILHLTGHYFNDLSRETPFIFKKANHEAEEDHSKT